MNQGLVGVRSGSAITPDWLSEARRAARRIRATTVGNPVARHHVYVILLDEPDRSPRYGVYVGQSFYSPDARFEQHLSGHRASRVVRRCGIRLLPKLYQHLNPLAQWEAVELEASLAAALRRVVPWVEGGH